MVAIIWAVHRLSSIAPFVRLPEKIHAHDGYRQDGTNLPDTSLEALSRIDEFCVFRAKKQLFSLWDGESNYFNSD